MRPAPWHPPIAWSPAEEAIGRRIRRAKLFPFLRRIRHQLFDDAFGNRRYFRVHLVGGDLEDRFVLFDGIAGLFVPFQDGSFHDTFTHFWHYQVDKSHTLEFIKDQR